MDRPKDPKTRTTQERYEAGKFAREVTARNYHKHLEKQGVHKDFESVQRYINERADMVDKKQGRG